MLKSDLIQARLEELRIEAQNLIEKEGVTAEELDDITNKIGLEEKKLKAQLDIEAAERNSLEGIPFVPEPVAATTPTEPVNQLFEEAKDFQNFILGKPHNMERVENVLGTGSASSGGVAVGTTLSGEIIRELKERAGAYSFFSGRTGKGNWEILVVSEETPAEWVAEGESPAGTAVPKTSNVTLKQHRLYKEIALTQQLVNASSEEFVETIRDIVVDALIDTLEAAIFTGTGTNMPTGITVGLPTTRKITAATKGEVTLADLKKMKHKIKQMALKKSAWFMDSTTFLAIDLLVDNNGRPLLQPNPALPTEDILLGLPVKLTSGLNPVDTASKPIIALAHPNAYASNTQKTMAFDVYNDSTYKKKGMIGLAANIYVDGNRKDASKVVALFNPA